MGLLEQEAVDGLPDIEDSEDTDRSLTGYRIICFELSLIYSVNVSVSQMLDQHHHGLSVGPAALQPVIFHGRSHIWMKQKFFPVK